MTVLSGKRIFTFVKLELGEGESSYPFLSLNVNIVYNRNVTNKYLEVFTMKKFLKETIDAVTEGMRVTIKICKTYKWAIPLVAINVLLSPIVILVLVLMAITKRGKELVVDFYSKVIEIGKEP